MSPLVDQAQAMLPRLRELAPRIEAARRVPADLANELAALGFFRMLVPRARGGLEVAARELVAVLEALGRGDGATAWITMTGASTGALAAYLPEAGAREVFSDPEGVYAGVFAPMGRATPCEGGYMLNGRWPFASGVENSTWRCGGAWVHPQQTEGPRRLPSGEPELRLLFFRAQDSRVVDTWQTSGLRGTGSHDMVVEDLFVPDHHTACLQLDRPVDGALYRVPLFGLLALGVGAVGIGIAQGALDTIAELGPRKNAGTKKLAETELAQVALARADARLRAARAFMEQATERAAHAAGDAVRAELRQAACHAAETAADVTDIAYRLGGGAAIYDSSPLQRSFRDVHTMTAHLMVSESVLRPIGRLLFGLPTDTAQL